MLAMRAANREAADTIASPPPSPLILLYCAPAFPIFRACLRLMSIDAAADAAFRAAAGHFAARTVFAAAAAAAAVLLSVDARCYG
jgi:hypothetical protein